MLVLFVSDCNMHESRDPICDLINVHTPTTKDIMRQLEASQIGVGRIGGSWSSIMQDGDLKYTVLKSGRLSEMSSLTYDIKYKLISGNY